MNLAFEFGRCGDVKNYKAVFSRLPYGSAESEGAIDYSVHDDPRSGCAHAYNGKSPMLVGPTEFVKAKDKVVRSLIWLDFAKEGGKLGASPLYFSLFHLSFKSVLSVFDRQTEKFSLFGVETFADRDRRIVERLAQIGNNSDNVAFPIGGNGLGKIEAVKYAAGLENRGQRGVDRVFCGRKRQWRFRNHRFGVWPILGAGARQGAGLS